MPDQRAFNLPFAGFTARAQEVEPVGGLQRFARQVRLRRRQAQLELVAALPLRSSSRVSMWMLSMLRDQPCSMAAWA